MWAYVAYGDPRQETLSVLRLQVVGPASNLKLWAKQLKGLETVWLPVEVTEDAIKQCMAKRLLPDTYLGRNLYLSMRSMSLDEKMRFKLNRCLVGDTQGWPFKGIGGQLFTESTECLVPAEDTLLYTDDNWPQDGLPTKEWGHSLRCLSFEDEHTDKLLKTYRPHDHNQLLVR